MAAWTMTINAPRLGDEYVITITKPAGFLRMASGALADTSVPPLTLDLHYATSGAPGSEAGDETWPTGRYKGTGPTPPRVVTVRAIADGTTVKKKYKPAIQDSSGGGPRVPRSTRKSK
ncbi:MAG: hypothetical protein ABI599_05820 [Flavobacteriales bacterium]